MSPKPLPKGMTTEAASLTKKTGHRNEEDYASIIGGEVTHDQAGKKDVVDSQLRTHSVKSGKKWQVLLYSRNRLESNTILRGLGNVSSCLIACLDALPENRTDREENKDAAKQSLQQPMKNLAAELAKPEILKAFFLKAAFEAGEVDYWGILPPAMDQRTTPKNEKEFHIFDAKEAVNVICQSVTVTNSKARRKGQADAQKVLFRTNRTLGEIEVRTDPQNYRLVKMWLDAARVLALLQEKIPMKESPLPQVTAYGKAHRFKQVQSKAAAAENLHPLAQAANAQLAEAAPEILELLSALGRRIYFPKGILSQSAEAKQKGHRFNATIGIATESGQAMHLPSLHCQLEPGGIAPDDAYGYAPAAGRAQLRRRWLEKQRAENPALRGKPVGLPIVTSALTHGLSLLGDLLVDPGDCLLLPDKLWGNYRLLYEVRLGAKIATFPFYNAAGGLDTAGFAEALARESRQRSKLLVLLNFPNNPTGYMPSESEGRALEDALLAQADAGTRLAVICDDAYFGLFYHLGGPSMTESLFGRLAGRHPNLLALRLDGATKELFAWGLRCGFLTLGPGRSDTAEAACAVLEAKLRGLIRSGVSNSPMLSQTLVERALDSGAIAAERAQKCDLLRARAQRVFEVSQRPQFSESWRVYPFNSGYFMCLELKEVAAEALRLHLLDHYGAGLIASGARDLRIAFSCLEPDEIEPLFECIHRGVQELRGG